MNNLEKLHGIAVLVKDPNNNLRIAKRCHSIIFDSQGFISAEDINGKRTIIGRTERNPDVYIFEGQSFIEIKIIEDISKREENE